jgi:hypothetical protein
MDGQTHAQSRYVRVDAARRIWLDAEPGQTPCVYLDRLPRHISMSNRAAVLELAEEAMAGRSNGVHTARSGLARPGNPGNRAEAATRRCGNRHWPSRKWIRGRDGVTPRA